MSFSVERSLVIRAPRSIVFSYFTDSQRFAAWWGEGSQIDGRPGGTVRICYPNGVVACGEITALEPEWAIAFTYGYEGEGKPIAAGGSRVRIELADHEEGTRLDLRHEVQNAELAQMHEPGWRYQLAVFAHVAGQLALADAEAVVDRYYRVWTDPEAESRRQALADLVTDDVTFRDPYGCTLGVDELVTHIGALQMHMPASRLERVGAVRRGQGLAVSGWQAFDEEGEIEGEGENIFQFSPDGRVRSVVGLWS